jgi:hypothetical protein
MLKTIIIDVINDKAIKLLHDLELLQLIRMRSEKQPDVLNWSERYKGAMSKQPVSDIDKQLQSLRNEWE